jgi:hypothetical protein
LYILIFTFFDSRREGRDPAYQNTRRDIPEPSNLYCHSRENLQFHSCESIGTMKATPSQSIVRPLCKSG